MPHQMELPAPAQTSESTSDVEEAKIGCPRKRGNFKRSLQAVLPKRFRPLYFVRCRCPKGRGQTQLSPQKDTRLPNPSRDFLQRQKSARCTSLLNGRPLKSEITFKKRLVISSATM